MSTSSSRRLKDRGGSTGKIIPSITPKTLTPISEKKPSLSVSGRKSIAKETANPRSVSRVSTTTAQKPVLRSMPKVSDVEQRSKSRGRSDSPSDFTRILSDMRKSRVSSGEGRSEVKGVSGLRDRKGFRDLNQKVGDKTRVSIDGKENKNLGKISGKKEENLNLSKLNVDNSDKVVSFNAENLNQVVNLKSDDSRICNVNQLSVRTVAGSVSKGLDEGKEKGVIEEPMSGRVGSKNKSKLHEKLAYLEGKVKRIASDIKKTKEMLDSNNNDESKMILSDIQAKISGIEKAMGTVMADSSDHVSGGCSSNGSESKGVENESVQPMDDGGGIESNKVSVKGLSCEELEARLFPHHRLLRNRAVPIEPSAEGTRVGGLKSKGELKNLGDEDPIAVEFLASLNKMQPEVGAKDVDVARTLDGNKVQEADDAETSTGRRVSGVLSGTNDAELDLQADERLEEFDDEQENRPEMMNEEAMDDDSINQLIELGRKTSTGGWFVSEGESVLLAHDDGSCSFYDIANQEEKAEYRPPAGISENIWRDCWIIRAPSADGCSGKYVVAASAGNTMDSGFCSWDFYSKDVRACHLEDNTGIANPRVALGRLPDNVMQRRGTQSNMMSSENRQWWYRPCGPLIISTASCQRAVKVFDIRDGEQIMKWDVQKPVLAMDYSSPVQWRNRGKAVIAETEAVSLWDVSSLNPRALLTVPTSGRRISALHINNTDAELGGGVRQRASSSEAEGNDGVFCTADSINVLDFRQPLGIGLKIPKIGVTVQSIYSRGDSVYLGCSNVISAVKKQVQSQVLQFSIRKQKIVNTYTVPESNAHSHYKTLTQVWGNSNMVMGVCGLGLYVFDSFKDDGLPSFVSDSSSPHNVKEIIGPDDLYSPSFDCLSSQILLISRDRPAMWRHLS